MSTFNVKLSSGFTIKPAAIRRKIEKTSHKDVKRLLYCLARREEDGWKAHVNTRGLENYQNTTILDFTPNSFNLKNRADLFSKEKDKSNHYIRIIRSIEDCKRYYGDEENYTTLCDNRIFSGYIVKIDGKQFFELKDFVGHISDFESLLTTPIKVKEKIKDEYN